MNSKDKHNKSSLKISEALETLSGIADMEFNYDIEGAKVGDLVASKSNITNHVIDWLHPQDVESTINLVKETFHVILGYLRHFDRKDGDHSYSDQTLEGIKTIMVLVGEAAKKLDRYTTIFYNTTEKNVTALKEYKQLQEFYLNRIASKIENNINESVLARWILALSKKMVPGQKHPILKRKGGLAAQHIFIDLESVKKDTEYELFFIRKEDGSYFFNPRLIRNIKLVCEFGSYLGETKEKDELIDIKLWQDNNIYVSAKNIMREVTHTLEVFYREAQEFKEWELVKSLKKAIIALMLCCNGNNRVHLASVKSSIDYFTDFQYFLRLALSSLEYQRLIAYPPREADSIPCHILETVHALCHALFVHEQGAQGLMTTIRELIHQENLSHFNKSDQNQKSSGKSVDQLSNDYTSITKVIRRHPNGPLNKLLDVLELGDYHTFDPYLQHNIPSQIYSIHIHDRKVINLRIPSPTHQEFIHKANVNEEFKGFLRSLDEKEEASVLLLINLQDRNSWKEQSRARALENLINQEGFSESLCVVTLPKESEFFNQLAPYHEDRQSKLFFQHFRENFVDEKYGFFFPEEIKKALFPVFFNGALKAIHRIFFGNKNVLSREQRLNFIEIFYLFLQLKLMDLVKPEAVSFICKDGIDVSGATDAQLFMFLKLLNEESLTHGDLEHVNMILHAPAFLIRERAMLPECFYRMRNALKQVESVKKELGQDHFFKIIHEAFTSLFKTPVLFAKAIAPQRSYIREDFTSHTFESDAE